MNRIDRLLAIVLELQGRGKLTADSLASTFEISKRTVYRDVEALCEMGVPLVAVPGQGYSLMPGYFLPPLRFSTDEAIMLMLGSGYMADSFDAEYRFAAQSAGRKIVGALPADLRAEVESLKESIRFVVSSLKDRTQSKQLLQQVRRAIIKQRTVSFEYHTRHGRANAEGSWSSRKADPYGIVNITGVWYMVGYCHMRHDVRIFRIERMENVHVLDDAFTRPADFKFGEREGGARRITVRVLISYEVESWMREEPFYYTVAEEETPAGVLLTLAVRHERDILQWLMSWGRYVRVLEPQSLIDLLVKETEAILQNHKNAESLLT